MASDSNEPEYNKELNTLTESYVLLNGVVLTVEGASYSKIHVPDKVTQISCGMAHTICKTLLKKVFSWGSNRMGQLGTGDFYEKRGCRLVEYFSKRRIPVCQVGATAFGSVVLDQNGKIYWFGTNGTIKNACVPE